MSEDFSQSGGYTSLVGKERNFLAFPVTFSLPVQETQVQSLGWEDPLEEKMATHSNILARENPMDKGSDRLRSMGLQRDTRDLLTKSK